MQITKQQEQGVLAFSVEGSFDTKTAKPVEDALNDALTAGQAKLLVDFGKLDYISSVGLRVLLSTMKKVKKAGGKLHLSGMNPTVKEVFDISGFSNIFTIFGTRAEALAAF